MTRPISRPHLLLCAVGAATAAAVALTSLAPTAVASAAADRSAPPGSSRGTYDARQPAGQAATAARLRAASVAEPRAARSLRRSLGADTLFDLDGSTGTIRFLANLDGTLTGRSGKPAREVAMSFVRSHHAALGLSALDLTTFRLRRDYVDIAGTHHLSWIQAFNGQEVFGNGLTASVDRTGRLLTVGGSPVNQANPPARTAQATVGSADAAIRLAHRANDDSSQAATSDDDAQPVLLVTAHRTYDAWRTITMSGDHPALTVLDRASGRVLYRRSLSSDAASDPVARVRKSATGLAYRYFPGARQGGTATRVDFTGRGWLSARARTLSGNNSHTYSDVDDNNLPSAAEEVKPSKKGTSPHWGYRLKPFDLADVSFCGNPYPCSWDPSTPYSWKTNRAQNATQVFFYVNNFHDHLASRPIGFNEAAGNFQVRNRTGKGQGGDPVDTQTDDGANTADGLPDGSHIDNANMDTPPDGFSPRMQMYLQHQPGSSYPDGDPFAPTNVGDEADTVYHEYTHGLSNRLVVDVDGQSTLGPVQAGAMGEAWSDWYAMDYLVGKGLQKDKPGVADVVLFQYDGEGVYLDRTEPIDCAVAATDKRCTGGATGRDGGYTYADYGAVSGSPEVHSDGEIWAQTLWSLRDALGSKLSESLITRAMELAPANPSFLDMRDAILIADTAVYGGRNHQRIWKVFASRGMGFYAGSLGGNDASPAADTHRHATSAATASFSGTVTDQDTGEPVAGVPVTLVFGGSGTVNPTAVTDDAGQYSIGPVPAGDYAKVVVTAPGYDTTASPVSVTDGTVLDFTVRRDWAAESGGASVTDFTGPDLTPYGCGPAQVIDGSQVTGWSSTTGDDDGTPTNVMVPKTVTIDLGRAIDVTQLAVDPSAVCGDGGSASLGDYRIDTSVNGSVWTQASSGTFGADDRGRLNLLDPAPGTDVGVRYVRLTMLGNQTPDFATNCPDGAYSGCSFTDVAEMEVYGTPVG